MELVDTHCHLQFDKYGAEIDDVYDRAIKTGVTKMIAIGTDLDDSRKSIKLAKTYDGVWAAVGAHPHETEKLLENQNAIKEITELLSQPKVVAVGEIGLDYYKNDIPKETQLKALRLQIETGLLSGLAFSFHVRDAWTDFWQVFDEYKSLKGVIHSFCSGTKQLNAALDRGLYISLNGIMTFTRDHAQLEAAKLVPKDKLMLETDAPFLTPMPKRNEICEPRHVKNVAEFLADLRGESLEELCAYTTKNAVEVFKLT